MGLTKAQRRKIYLEAAAYQERDLGRKANSLLYSRSGVKKNTALLESIDKINKAFPELSLLNTYPKDSAENLDYQTYFSMRTIALLLAYEMCRPDKSKNRK